VAEQLRAAPDPADQHTGGHRVERASVADLAGAEDAAQPSDHVVRGEPAWLVDDHEA